ncbi:dihydrodipicolinate reductase, family protein [Mycobacterium xenopi 3993]|nr:dihydrodipicolinate reductase, family protein [Mycobacterium xenopi 3993]
MAIRVAHIGTGNVGRLALTQLLTDPRFDLTGVWVSSPTKVGKDAAELAGLDTPAGVTATDDLEALLATRPDCAVYCAMGDNRTPEAIKDCRHILAAGVNVVGSAPVVLQYPWQLMPDKYIKQVEDAAQQGNSSIFITGVDPGFANDLIPFTLAGTCQSIEQLRCMEIADYATYDGATVMFEVMGFGKPLDNIPILLQPGVLSIAWAHPSGSWPPGWVSNSTTSPKPLSANQPGRIRHRGRARAERQRGGDALPDLRRRQRPPGDSHRARHPVARRPAARLAAARPARRLVPGGNHRRAVLHRRYLPDQSQGRPQPCCDRGRGRTDRECHSRGRRRAAGNPDHPGPATDHRPGWNRF